MKKNFIKILTALLLITLIATGCGKKANLDDDKTVVSLKESKISATNYYNEIKKANITKLVDMIDHKLFDEKYKTDKEETESVEAQIKQIKSTYPDNEKTFVSVIKQYFGVNSEEELVEMLRLEYKRNEAVEDYIKENLKDSEIKKYYEDNIIGDIKASHILIKTEVDSNATEEEKEKAEKKALKKAKEVIKKLEDGKDFAELAKKYSDDTATKNKGGDLDYFKADEMDEDFVAAAKELKNKEYSKEPVKTQFGYHIILKVDQKEKEKLKEVKSDIKEKLTAEKLSNDPTLHYKTLVEIRKENNIKWNDDELEKQYKEVMEELIESAKNNAKTN